MEDNLVSVGKAEWVDSMSQRPAVTMFEHVGDGISVDLWWLVFGLR